MALDFGKLLSEVTEKVNELSRMEEAGDVEGLAKVLREEKSSTAAASLGDVGDARAVKPLQEALQYENPEVRRAATTALGKIDDPSVIEPLIQALDDRDDDVRRRAVEALERIGGPDAERALSEYGAREG